MMCAYAYVPPTSTGVFPGKVVHASPVTAYRSIFFSHCAPITQYIFLSSFEDCCSSSFPSSISLSLSHPLDFFTPSSFISFVSLLFPYILLRQNKCYLGRQQQTPTRTLLPHHPPSKMTTSMTGTTTNSYPPLPTLLHPPWLPTFSVLTDNPLVAP